MNIKEVKDLIQGVLQSDISEFELEHTGTKVRLKRGYNRETLSHATAPAPQSIVSYIPPQPSVAEIPAPSVENTGDSEDSTLHIVASPIVGTFYRASKPGAEPYVKLGDHVQEGSILCLIEAMKLMNEIPSDVAGEIVRVYVENGHAVEFGQKLFGIRPRK